MLYLVLTDKGFKYSDILDLLTDFADVIALGLFFPDVVLYYHIFAWFIKSTNNSLVG